MNDNDIDTEKQEIPIPIPIQNSVERAMREVPLTPDNNDGALMEVAIAMREKNAIVEKYLSENDLKTEVTKTERQMIPLVLLLAEEPFYSTREFFRVHKSLKEYEKIKPTLVITELETWAYQFLKYGLCQDRKGRLEDKEVIGSLFAQETDIKQSGSNANQISKI